MGIGAMGPGAPPRTRIYRRIPGTHRYYNVLQPSEQISDWAYRQWRKTATSEQLQAVREYLQGVRTEEVSLYWYAVEGFQVAAGQAGEYLTAAQVRSDPLFQDAYQTLRLASYWERTFDPSTPEGQAARADLNRPDGPRAQALVLLGMRLPEDTHPVGESPPGYSKQVREELLMRAAYEWGAA